MSKINRIQQELKSIEQGAFQKLCDAYLHKEGHRDITSLGSVIGANKTRTGQPDTLVVTADGKYVLVEYTTQQTGLKTKLHGDLDTCLNPKETGIELDQLKEVILCFNSDIDGTLRTELTKKATDAGCDLSLFGMSKLSFGLYQDYPGLAREFLGVEVDTGQVLDIQDFVKQYDKNALTTPLDMNFHFREEELKQVLTGLEEGNLVLLAGPAGVGKTRLALEASRQYKDTHPETKIRCIFSRQLDLFQDVSDHFGGKERFVIVVDDANRTSRFSYFTHLLQQGDLSGRIKVIATVRGYAQEKIQRDLDEYGPYQKVEVQPFSKQQIASMVEQEFGIKNHVYLERITRLAEGNPRLAVMMARLAVQENTLKSIADVSALYDTYFASISREMEALKDDRTLKTAGLLAFYRSIDRTDMDRLGQIEEDFGLSPEELWYGIRILHDLEAVDIYEDEVAKVADQSLATYFFYRVFFRDQLLPLSPFLQKLYPRTDDRLRDAIYPCVDAFDFALIQAVLRPEIKKALEEFQTREPKNDPTIDFFSTFWFVDPTLALRFAQDLLEVWKKSVEKEEPVDPATISFEPDGSRSTRGVLRLLAAFRSAESAHRKMGLELLLDAAASHPKWIPMLLDVFVETFGFDPSSSAEGCVVQHELVDELWQRCEEGESFLYSRMFICVAQRFLQTEHESTSSESRGTVSFRKVHLPVIDSVLALRQRLWEHLFTLFSKKSLAKHVHATIRKHASSGYLVDQKEMIATDAPQVLDGLSTLLNPERLEDCLLVQDYLSLLRSHDIEYDMRFEEQFTVKAFQLSKILVPAYEPVEEEGAYEAYEKSRRQGIVQEVEHLSREEFRPFFADVATLLEDSTHSRRSYEITEGLFIALHWLAENKQELFATVLEDYIADGNRLGFDRQHHVASLLRPLIEIQGKEKSFALLRGKPFPSQEDWQFEWFQALKPEEIEDNDAAALLEWFETLSPEHYPYLDSSFLERYHSHDPALPGSIVQIVLAQSETVPRAPLALRGIFSIRQEPAVSLLALFGQDVPLLKKAYLAALGAETNSTMGIDYRGESFGELLDIDPAFAGEYISWLTGRKDFFRRLDDSRDYTFLWEREDGEEVMRSILRSVCALGDLYRYEHLPVVFFVRGRGRAIKDEVQKRQMQFLLGEIETSAMDTEYMRLLFMLATAFSRDEQSELLAAFVKRNSDFELFQRLHLEPSSESWSGSRVPGLQQKIDFYRSLLPLFGSVKLLQHRQYIEQRIQGYQREIAAATKRDFLDDVR